MGSIYVAVNFALAQQGKPYHAFGARFGPNYYDCSGLMKASCDHAGIWTPSYCTNSVGFYNWGVSANKIVSVDEGIHTYGAMMIRGNGWGYGPLGHICFSLGDGRVMEARGTFYGCRVSTVYGRTWHSALIVPGAEYRTPAQVASDAAAAAAFAAAMAAIKDAVAQIYAQPLHIGDQRADLVKFCKALLNKKFNAKLNATDPHFRDKMERVVASYQRSHNLPVTGKIGPKTIDLLVR